MPQSSSQSDVRPQSTPSDGYEETRRSAETETVSSKPPASYTVCNPANKFWTKATRREIFVRHLSVWASNHDSSAYFHGSISLQPQGATSGEIVELGKSVSCILTSLGTTKKIVIRLFQSQQHGGDVRHQRGIRVKNATSSLGTAIRSSTSGSKNRSGCGMIRRQQNRPMVPYKMVIRSGSGWISAREYLDKHYFAHLVKPDVLIAPKLPPPRPTPGPLLGWQDLSANNVDWGAPTMQREPITSPKPLVQNESLYKEHKGREPLRPARDTVTISPLFRPFSKLPIELQDEILYHAIGYTRCIRLTPKESILAVSAMPKSPITISNLFRISNAINQRSTTHIFRSTNFHFGITGLTKFLWQLGPTNRSQLRHVTVHFGRDSLLHCVRWLAPDEIYEVFEPPVTTNPKNLTLFWRCQLQDLIKELNLLTLTIDIRDVPPADVPMIIKILNSVIGSVERIRVIDYSVRAGTAVDEHTTVVSSGSPYMPRATWRELSVRYYFDYRFRLLHMSRAYQVAMIDLDQIMHLWMDKNKAFFDS